MSEPRGTLNYFYDHRDDPHCRDCDGEVMFIECGAVCIGCHRTEEPDCESCNLECKDRIKSKLPNGSLKL